MLAIYYVKPYFPYTHDPRPVVLDEVIGCLWTFCHIKVSINTLVAGVLIFRFLDIAKPGGLSYLERLPSPWGIMLDDVVAGMVTAVILYIATSFY